MKEIRWCGILQRIALAYFVVALVEIMTRHYASNGLQPGISSIFKLYLWHWIVAVFVLIVYLSMLYGIYVPDWQFRVKNTESPWCWAPFEPEGILSSISAILSTLIRVHFGHVLCILYTGGYVEYEVCVGGAGMDRDERDAGVRDGGCRNLCRFYQWLVL